MTLKNYWSYFRTNKKAGDITPAFSNNHVDFISSKSSFYFD